MELLPCNKYPPKVVNARFFIFCSKSFRLQLSFAATHMFSKKIPNTADFFGKTLPGQLAFLIFHFCKTTTRISSCQIQSSADLDSCKYEATYFTR